MHIMQVPFWLPAPSTHDLLFWSSKAHDARIPMLIRLHGRNTGWSDGLLMVSSMAACLSLRTRPIRTCRASGEVIESL